MSEATEVKPQTKSPPELASRTVKWLVGLPEHVRPKILPGLYVRIANTLAQRWTEPDLARAYLDELLVDRRGDRAGFPDDILVELSTLKHYYNKDLHPIKEDVWTKIWSGME